MRSDKKYCLDSNVLIQGWQSYYSPNFFRDYWAFLETQGIDGNIYIPAEVYNEVNKKEDELSIWLKDCKIPVHPTSESVIECLKAIFDSNPIHRRLVDSTRQRSLADPWVIAHAMSEGACVVTKELKLLNASNRIKIPDVCENMGIRCINDFQMITEMSVQFKCEYN